MRIKCSDILSISSPDLLCGEPKWVMAACSFIDDIVDSCDATSMSVEPYGSGTGLLFSATIHESALGLLNISGMAEIANVLRVFSMTRAADKVIITLDVHS